jgi:acyl-CoA thioesterase-1
VVLFVGTSLTAGYGLDDPTDAFPGLIQRRIDEAGLAYRVVNGGVSGDTSAGGLRRLDRLLRDSVAVLVLELGANDGLRGLPLDALRQNLEDAIALARARHPEVTVVLAGMEAPPNLGPRYTRAFRAVYREVAQDRGTRLIPFLLDGVAGLPELNQPDGIHPTAAGHRRIADLVWAELEPILSRGPARLSPRPAP